MAYTNVASCVISIVGSFSNGLDVFKKLRDKRRRRKRSKKLDKVDEEELSLSRSLRQGPEDIAREYQRNVYGAGQDFEIGDAIAQTSLAEIILRLNTGLVSIISSFLSNDKNGVQLDYQSLTDLSERSRVDTCRTLRHLFMRMARLKRPLAIAPEDRQNTDNRVAAPRGREHAPKKQRAPPTKSAKVRGPMIAQVVIENSSKPSQIALVRPGERRKKSSSGSSSHSKSASESSTAVSTPLATPPPEYAAFDTVPQTSKREKLASERPKARRQQSIGAFESQPIMSNVGGRRAAQSTPRLQSTLPPTFEPMPPIPNMAAVSSADLPPRRRKPTPTYYSVASDQTKIGEIPLHKWAEPYDFDRMSILNREAYTNGWPVNQLACNNNQKKKFGFGRLFGRKG
ncbi:uncharacterized protein LTR77_003064 [Saxophila tyrrhenica]|uniref:Uncharacterized protein n=1 Tax=Saxophila tyrrhenica TaxID=1690608 RepID=A0AAV9PJV8_9PEZI|nr:hypothetical protein LTR77_003064 [Saxophila tyrrhenica]